jgi:hypothetical protein
MIDLSAAVKIKINLDDMLTTLAATSDTCRVAAIIHVLAAMAHGSRSRRPKEWSLLQGQQASLSYANNAALYPNIMVIMFELIRSWMCLCDEEEAGGGRDDRRFLQLLIFSLDSECRHCHGVCCVSTLMLARLGLHHPFPLLPFTQAY